MNPGYQPEYRPKAAGYYMRARRTFKKIYPNLHTCSICGIIKNRYMEIHHIDKDITNNDISNLEMVCRDCHVGIHS